MNIQWNIIYGHTVKSKTIYITIVLSLITFLVLLPFIFVEITVQGDGLIRPVSEKSSIKPIISGQVTSIFIKEGQKVNKGDTLFILKGENIESKMELVRFQFKQASDLVEDLKILTQNNNSIKLKTSTYKQALITHQQKIAEIENRKYKAKKELERNTVLFQKGAIPEKEFDDLNYSLRLIENELKSFKESVLSNWQTELVLKKTEKEQYQAQLAQLKYNKSIQTVTAPVNGTIEQFSGIYIGSTLQSGQTVAIISPENQLIAEIHVLL